MFILASIFFGKKDQVDKIKDSIFSKLTKTYERCQ